MTCKTSIAATISVIDTANPADTTIALKRKPGSARMSVAGSCFRNLPRLFAGVQIGQTASQGCGTIKVKKGHRCSGSSAGNSAFIEWTGAPFWL